MGIHGNNNPEISRTSLAMAASATVEDIKVDPTADSKKPNQDQEEYYDEDQLFQDHEDLHKRLGKSLYYGGSESTSADRLSMPLTELCVDHFNRVMDLNTKAEDDDESRLDLGRAAQVSRETCASPTSLVLALLYLDRLRGSNPAYLTSGKVSSSDLFLVSLMVASKYLYDDGEEDEVFNEEWAASGGKSRKELNKLEIEFLTSIDWRIHVTPRDFEAMAETIERAVAKKQLTIRHWEDFTYTDLLVLSNSVRTKAIWDHFVGLAIKVTTVVVAAYAASLMSMIGTCHLLNQVKLGPNAISQSVNTLYASLGAHQRSSPTKVIEDESDKSDLMFETTPGAAANRSAAELIAMASSDFCLNSKDCDVPTAATHDGAVPTLPPPFIACDTDINTVVLPTTAQGGFPMDPGKLVEPLLHHHTTSQSRLKDHVLLEVATPSLWTLN